MKRALPHADDEFAGGDWLTNVFADLMDRDLLSSPEAPPQHPTNNSDSRGKNVNSNTNTTVLPASSDDPHANLDDAAITDRGGPPLIVHRDMFDLTTFATSPTTTTEFPTKGKATNANAHASSSTGTDTNTNADGPFGPQHSHANDSASAEPIIEQPGASSEPPHEVDAAEVVANELRHMSLDERQVALEDIHGITKMDEETPSFIAAKLDDMSIELGLIPVKPAYDAAKKQNQAYVEGRTLRLKFLRCVRYNSKLAAIRFVGWFDVKLELFGARLLTEDITMFDLPPEAQEIMSSGRVQLLPVRDSSGRAIVSSVCFNSDMFSTSAASHFFFYFSMVLLEDDLTQMSGIVGVHGMHMPFSEFTQAQRENYIASAATTKVNPVRFQGFHFVAGLSPTLRRVADLLQVSFSKDLRHRFRIHSGTLEQCKYSLMGYGIPKDILPITNDGQIKMTAHMRWLQQRRHKDTLTVQARSNPSPIANLSTRATDSTIRVPGPPGASSAACQKTLPKVIHDGTHHSSPLVSDASSSTSSGEARCLLSASESADTNAPIVPTDNDVLLGRGRPYQEHAGNVYLKALIVQWFDKYNMSPRLGKMAVAEQLVHLIHLQNGRFIKKVTDDEWEEVELPQAREKVSHGFRKKREMDAARAKANLGAGKANTGRKKADKKAFGGVKRVKV